MVRFRSESYLYPHVEAIQQSDGTGLTLRYFGAMRPAVAMHFSLVDINAKPIVQAGKFLGYLETEDAKVEVNLAFKDRSGKELDEKSSYHRVGVQKMRRSKNQQEKIEP